MDRRVDDVAHVTGARIIAKDIETSVVGRTYRGIGACVDVAACLDRRVYHISLVADTFITARRVCTPVIG